MTNSQLEDIFSYHSPTEEQKPKYDEVNRVFLDLAKTINELMPAGPGATVSIRKLNEARNAVNSAIAYEGRF